MSEVAWELVLKLHFRDVKAKRNAMKNVSGLPGIDFLTMDMKEKKLTVIGIVDPFAVFAKLTKCCRVEIVSVGPAKEVMPQQPKKSEETKKKTQKEDDLEQIFELLELYEDQKSRAKKLTKKADDLMDQIYELRKLYQDLKSRLKKSMVTWDIELQQPKKPEEMKKKSKKDM